MSKNRVRKFPFRKASRKDGLGRKIDLDSRKRYGVVEEDVWYPNLYFVEETHKIMLEKYGGFLGFERGPTVYEGILQKAKQTEGIYRKAAILLRGIAIGRIFEDGNHRTALATTETFLKMNGEEMAEENPEKRYTFIKGILRYNIDEVKEWLEHGCIKEASDEGA